jgi:nuclear pore complex protein Nup107
MIKIGGSFWEGGLPAVEKGAKSITAEETEAEEAEWTKEVTAALDTLKTVDVADGYVINNFLKNSPTQIT